jgi:electron transfer flavoprotein alpha subunit
MIFVLAEHRSNKLRDITFQMLAKGRTLANKTKSELVVVLLEDMSQSFEHILNSYADKTLLVKDKYLGDFNSEVYQEIISRLISKHNPLLTLIGHTSYGIELASSLAVEQGSPIVSDCIDIDVKGNDVRATRQIYGGKVNSLVTIEHEHCIATVRPSVFKAGEKDELSGSIIDHPFSIKKTTLRKRFIKMVTTPTGNLDITQADKIVSIGRGVKKREDIKLIEDMAESMGAVLACSRAIVDKGWLPVERQVGSSGRTVNAKLYLAIGISGASQHLAGMNSCETIIAVNEDPYAPILSVAHYAIVDDLYKVIPVLLDKFSK